MERGPDETCSEERSRVERRGERRYLLFGLSFSWSMFTLNTGLLCRDSYFLYHTTLPLRQ